MVFETAEVLFANLLLRLFEESDVFYFIRYNINFQLRTKYEGMKELYVCDTSNSKA